MGVIKTVFCEGWESEIGASWFWAMCWGQEPLKCHFANPFVIKRDGLHAICRGATESQCNGEAIVTGLTPFRLEHPKGYRRGPV